VRQRCGKRSALPEIDALPAGFCVTEIVMGERMRARAGQVMDGRVSVHCWPAGRGRLLLWLPNPFIHFVRWTQTPFSTVTVVRCQIKHAAPSQFEMAANLHIHAHPLCKIDYFNEKCIQSHLLKLI